MGLQRTTSITTEQRKQLDAWWEAEREFISDEIERNQGS
jgi:hypothetical protein